MYTQRRYVEAHALISKALETDPNSAEAHSDLGMVLQELERHEEALTSCNRALAIRPDFAEALYNRGVALVKLARVEEALASYDRALAVKPDYAEALCARGNAMMQLKRVAEALASYDRALAIRPDYAWALNNRGNVLLELRRHEEALASYDRALAIRPDFAEVLYNRGVALLELRRVEEAMTSYDRALAIKPDYPEALNNRGLALLELNRFEEAVTNYDRALAIRPDFAEALNNRGLALLELKRVEEAVASHRRALAIRPDFADAGFNLAQALLLLGDFETGWAEYEWRWWSKRYSPKKFTSPLWRGEDLTGKTILLYAEQGLGDTLQGDTLQFVRYAPLVAARGGRVILEVQPRLARLLVGVTGVAQVIARGEPLPDFDLCCPLLSLPGRLGTTLATIPAEPSYVSADSRLAARWAEAIGDEPNLKVGLAWAGNPNQQNDNDRSIALERLRPLLEVPGIRWVSLQVGERAGDVAHLPPGSITDLSSQLTDFAETAAVMVNLDLVISIDTSVAHLAGALGRPVWTLLSFVPDWRWLVEREDSPWYPTMRLFRQPARGDWESVI